MAERIVYSTLCALDGASRAQLDPLIEMATLWAAHLRGPARFDGRIILLSNVPDLRVPGVHTIAVPFLAADRRDLFLERVRRFRCLPIQPSDQVMQMDLDALAVVPLDELFGAIRPGTLMAATSGSSPLIHDHAGGLMTRPERWRYRVRGWYHRAGVSACVTACDGTTWPHVMRRWSAAIRARGRGRPIPLLGDQSFLNFLFVTGAAPIRRLPRRLIYHVRRPGVALDDPSAVRATVLHFPLPRKLEEMRRWSRL